MDLGQIKDKVYQSFQDEFYKLDCRDIEKIEIESKTAWLIFKTGLTYWCKLHSRGVKKDSWRMLQV